MQSKYATIIYDNIQYTLTQGVPKNALSELPPIGVELSESLPPKIWWQFWQF